MSCLSSLCLVQTKNPRLTGNRGFFEILCNSLLGISPAIAVPSGDTAPNGHRAHAARGAQMMFKCSFHLQNCARIRYHASASVKTAGLGQIAGQSAMVATS
jgi:hypothetical protein